VNSSQNSVEELLIQELVFERFQNPRLDLVTPDGEPVVAGAFVSSAEACEPIAAGHDEPSAADAAFREPREQVPRPSCEADVAGRGDRSSRCALTVLRGVPEFVSHYPQRRKLLGDHSAIGFRREMRLPVSGFLTLRKRFQIRRPMYSWLFRMLVPRFDFP
jgi:hypothetical protein